MTLESNIGLKQVSKRESHSTCITLTPKMSAPTVNGEKVEETHLTYISHAGNRLTFNWSIGVQTVFQLFSCKQHVNGKPCLSKTTKEDHNGTFHGNSERELVKYGEQAGRLLAACSPPALTTAVTFHLFRQWKFSIIPGAVPIYNECELLGNAVFSQGSRKNGSA